MLRVQRHDIPPNELAKKLLMGEVDVPQCASCKEFHNNHCCFHGHPIDPQTAEKEFCNGWMNWQEE